MRTLPDKAVFNNSGVNGSGALDVAPGATITLLDDAGKLTLTGSNAVNQTFCRVTVIVPNDNGTFTPSAINIEIWLPETSWNQRYEGVGGGGFAGTISAKASVESTPTGLVNALNAGYATASTDTGHSSASQHRNLAAGKPIGTSATRASAGAGLRERSRQRRRWN